MDLGLEQRELMRVLVPVVTPATRPTRGTRVRVCPVHTSPTRSPRGGARARAQRRGEVHAGHQYRAHHHLGTDGPGQSGLDVYSLTKGLGNEVARVFTQNFPIYVGLRWEALSRLQMQEPAPNIRRQHN
eukprot:COSAG04_NODE_1078_length_8422_cov_5.090833_3_plen_129_part_00